MSEQSQRDIFPEQIRPSWLMAITPTGFPTIQHPHAPYSRQKLKYLFKNKYFLDCQLMTFSYLNNLKHIILKSKLVKNGQSSRFRLKLISHHLHFFSCYLVILNHLTYRRLFAITGAIVSSCSSLCLATIFISTDTCFVLTGLISVAQKKIECRTLCCHQSAQSTQY